MAVKKSELYASLWKSCDELRGSMDASQYKDYILVMLFMKYVSDKAASRPDYLLDVPPGGSFADMVAVKGNPEIGDKINKIIAKLADANESLKGAIDVADFAEEDKLGKGQDMVVRLSKLIGIFEDPALDFRGNHADGDDLLGDAYEYLMRHFATESGKSKGQFYTPAEVSRIMAQVIGLHEATSADQSIYDPTCGSGSLLLKAHDEAKSRTGLDLAIYGQEMDNATSALARMNMVLHDAPTAEIAQDNTLSKPRYRDANTGGLKTFDFVVANPPFSAKTWTNGFDPANDEFHRFPYGLPPKKNGDYAFLLQILASLKSTGRGAIILPHGVLFRGNSEGLIRREIVNRGYVKGIIGLPPNLFYGTGIPACIIVLDKSGADGRDGIFMIDARHGFMKDGPKNRLRAQDIHRIVDTFARYQDIPGYARFVPLTEIQSTDFNLSISRYIDSQKREDLQDSPGHLAGGIPVNDVEALASYWAVCPTLRQALFRDNRAGYLDLAVEKLRIKAAIYEHPEFVGFVACMDAHFTKWRQQRSQGLRSLGKGCHPKDVISDLAESLLSHYADQPLIDRYDIYQHLMDYWIAIMQDDVYMIAADGWVGGAKPREILQVKNKDGKLVWPETYDFLVGKRRFRSDLIPASVLITHFLSTEKSALDELETQLTALEQETDEQREELGVEGGLLEDVTEAGEDKLKITAAEVKNWLKKNQTDPDLRAEAGAVAEYASLLDQQTKLKGKIGVATSALHAAMALSYSRLTDADVKSLVVDDKWLGSLERAVKGEVDRVSQELTQRLRELAERYEAPLQQITNRVAQVESQAELHLENALAGLLSGKTRLPGFDGDWKPTRLGEVATFYKGKGLPKSDLDPFGAEPCIHYGELFTRYPETIREVLSRTSAPGDWFRSVANDVLMPTSDVTPNGLAKASCVTTAGVILGGDILVIRTRAEVVHGPFLSYVIRHAQEQILQLVTGTTVFHLYATDMKKFSFLLPSVSEQKAIVAVLDGIDADVAILETKLAKVRQLKLGMTQNLLSGRTA